MSDEFEHNGISLTPGSGRGTVHDSRIARRQVDSRSFDMLLDSNLRACTVHKEVIDVFVIRLSLTDPLIHFSLRDDSTFLCKRICDVSVRPEHFEGVLVVRVDFAAEILR